MADEKDDDNLEGQDESEYHFTEEEETNYDLENENPEESETAKPAESVSLKDRAVAFFNQNRRPILGGLVFLVVLFIVYKMIMPAAPPPPSTDIAPVAAGPKAVTPATTPAAPAQPPAAPIDNLASTNPLVGSFPPSTTPPANATGTPGVTGSPITQPGAAPTTPAAPGTLQGQTVSQTPSPLPGQVIAAPPAGTLPGQTTPATTVAAGTVPTSIAPGTTLTTPGQVPSAGQPSAIQTTPPPTPIPAGQTTTTTYTVPSQSVDNRLSTEQQNAISEYAAKLAAADAQNAALQNKIQDLNNRMGNIEAGLNQITQILIRRQSSRAVAVRTEVHVPYAVTAIIPGRAWLKSECGDTVTVAEGDVLKGIGRITKIDPYDGIVVIDTGIKPVTLTYGATG